MIFIWDYIVRSYNVLFDEMSHALTKDWLLIPSPFSLLAILLTYNIFCIKIGPMMMKSRPPYKLKTTITVYNIFQILISLYIFYEGCLYIFSGKFNFQCEGPDEAHGVGGHTSQIHQLYFMLKLLELLDTVFFVLSKSYRQITFLHLYHHTLMPLVSWIAVKYVPGGQSAIIGTINSLIHVFMYIYYLISGLGPQYRKYLWWKRHLTKMQIVLFLVIFIHSYNSLFYSCSFPNVLKVVCFLESNVFIYLFSNFYYETYIKKEMMARKHFINKESTTEALSESHENYVEGNLKMNSCSTEVSSKNNSSGKLDENNYIDNKYESGSTSKNM